MLIKYEKNAVKIETLILDILSQNNAENLLSCKPRLALKLQCFCLRFQSLTVEAY